MDKTLLEEACSEWAATRGTVGIIQQIIINNQIQELEHSVDRLDRYFKLGLLTSQDTMHSENGLKTILRELRALSKQHMALINNWNEWTQFVHQLVVDRNNIVRRI